MSLLAHLAVAFLPVALSQISTTAICDEADLNWTFNSAGSSPCQVVAALGGVCTDSGEWRISPLPPGQVYIPSVSPDPCQCSTVTYSMLSACAACQGAKWLDFDQFSKNCTSIFFSTFPKPLPAGVKVPAWAYNDIQLTSDTFDLAAAHLLADVPESTAVASATFSSTSTTTPKTPTSTMSSIPNSTTLTSSGNPSSTSDNVDHTVIPLLDSSGSSTHAIAIAASTAGGGAALFLIAGLFLFYLRRRQRLSQLAAKHHPVAPPDDAFEYPKTVEKPLASQPKKLSFYDPSDSSTTATYTGHYLPYSKTAAARNSLRVSSPQPSVQRSMSTTPTFSYIDPVKL